MSLPKNFTCQIIYWVAQPSSYRHLEKRMHYRPQQFLEKIRERQKERGCLKIKHLCLGVWCVQLQHRQQADSRRYILQCIWRVRPSLISCSLNTYLTHWGQAVASLGENISASEPQVLPTSTMQSNSSCACLFFSPFSPLFAPFFFAKTQFPKGAVEWERKEKDWH